ncbi:ATP synthase F1 subunit gamma [Candidatus Avelusimicrobium fimicolum]|jgi:F-type H+-transporting ATPase subunit gamma|uniref:ATP synthase F1 subunit gamma n=1 Tax=Candidatus Avelusimicrobium TaxID=2840538 RepID=UPI0015AC868C|nr:ATP synthase F1 subunit gamma [Spirochaetia bacterium]MDY3911238.1 ATP synthase F1 subunit gamma [Elusimicrobiaceae bacterium]
MESLRDIRQNIKAIKSTQQIMQTMKMISNARIRRAQDAMTAARPFAKKMYQMVDDLKQDILAMPQPDDAAESWAGRFFINKTGDPKKVGLLVITGDKGLAGSFNAVILRSALHFLKANQDKEVFVFAVGKKGRDFLARLKMPNLHLVYESVGIFPKVSYAHAELLGEAVLKTYFEQNLGSVTLIYNDFKSLASQNLVEQKFLPFHFEATENKKDESDFLFEPGMLEIFKLLVPRLVKANMYRMLLESQAANLAATMNAMDAASKNAGELVAALGVKLNKVRQASITNEILDIVNGAEALNS